ncbi:MAG TPA: amidohydrolase family protein [Gemmatimonadaceae bacterium]|nr:amidohydrolase family protein [Gemmatimonadaceae bacterium]
MRFTHAVIALVSMTASCRTPAPIQTLAGPLTGNSFVVRDVRVFDGERVIERTSVTVRDGRIARVGGSPPRDLPAIDGSGKTLTPGLIDAHGHVQNEAQLRDALRFGVTTVLDMFSRPEFGRTHRAQRDSIGATSRADYYSSGVPITSPRGMGTQFGIPLTTISAPGEAADIVASRVADGVDYVKIMYEPNAGIVSTISYETLAAVVREIRRQGKLSVVHVSSQQGARDVVRAGADGLAHLFADSLIDPALVQAIVVRRMFVVPTLTNFTSFHDSTLRRSLAADPRIAPYLSVAQRRALSGPTPSKDSPMAPYLARFNAARAGENVRRLHAAGVRILAGDDAASDLSPMGVSIHGELRLLTEAGLTPREALIAATSLPASIFGVSDRGRIVAGARADLLLVNGNPMEDITATRAIARVFKNGYEVSRQP